MKLVSLLTSKVTARMRATSSILVDITTATTPTSRHTRPHRPIITTTPSQRFFAVVVRQVRSLRFHTSLAESPLVLRCYSRVHYSGPAVSLLGVCVYVSFYPDLLYSGHNFFTHLQFCFLAVVYRL